MLPAVTVQGLGKRFYRYHADRPRTIMEAALAGWRRMQPADLFWALRDVSFTVMPGQMLGIIGHNGAGKSTLLQLVGGVGQPDQGKVKVNGRIGALLDLGASFHPDLTGRENVFVSAIAAGLTRREVVRRFEAIVEFADLHAFIDSPLRTYSTGMQMRLAFATAIHTEPDVLLIDEYLSVGDLAFQAKCLDRINQLKANGCAIVLISHTVRQIQQFCDQALWLSQGQVVAQGEPDVVAGYYASKMDAKPHEQPTRSCSCEIEITRVRLLDQRQMPIAKISSGDPLKIEIEYLSHLRSSNVIFSVSISYEDGQIYFNTHTKASNLSSVSVVPGKGKICLTVERLDLSGGKYFVNVGIFPPDWSSPYDYKWQLHPLEIRPTPKGSILNPPRSWEIVDAPLPVLPESH